LKAGARNGTDARISKNRQAGPHEIWYLAGPRSQPGTRKGMKQQTFEDYRKRMLAVLVHVQRHLDADLSLEELASVASFSPFHFHRIFRGLVGESVKEHVRRLRLERAAHRLRHTGQTVSEIALDAGYQSPEAFTRAFRKTFRRAPSEFRIQRRAAALARSLSNVHYLPDGALDDFRAVSRRSRRFEVRFERLPDKRVAFARNLGRYEDADEAIGRLLAWLDRRGLSTVAGAFFGIAYDDPEVTPPDKLRYDAAVEVPEKVVADGDIGIQILPRRKYAVTLHRGPYDTMGETYARFCGEWLPMSGREVLAAPALEFYLNSPHEMRPEALRTEIYLPVAA
jgi:AraC family transcriptional regulator